MGRRGPKPLPAEIHALRGNRSNRKRKKVQSKTENPVLIERPVDMPKEALPWWDAIVRHCSNIGTLRVSDTFLTWDLAVSLERYHRIQGEVRGKEVLEGANGRQYLNPRYRILDAERRAIHRMFVQMGLTPSARTALLNPGSERTPRDTKPTGTAAAPKDDILNAYVG